MKEGQEIQYGQYEQEGQDGQDQQLLYSHLKAFVLVFQELHFFTIVCRCCDVMIICLLQQQPVFVVTM